MIVRRIYRRLAAPLLGRASQNAPVPAGSARRYGLPLLIFATAMALLHGSAIELFVLQLINTLADAISNSTASIVARISREPGLESKSLDSASALILSSIAIFLLLNSDRGAARPYRVRRTKDRSGDLSLTHDEISKSRLTKKRLRILGTFMNDHHKLLPSDMTVGDLMTTTVRTALPSTPIGTLRAMANEYDIRHILICNLNQELVGVVSDRDLRHVAQELTASDLMNPCPTTISSQSLVNNAISILLYGHISSLPVVDDGRLVGILTTTDVAMTLQCAMLAVERIMCDLDSEQRREARACAAT